MAPKSSTGPSSFCEWVVGTSIESALGPIPRKPRHRDIVRVEVSTDDESEEDSLKITYPRPRRPRAKKKPASIKKVRFEDAPRKSALKKTTTTVVTSESDAETSSSEATASREASAESSGESSKSSKSRRKRSESESDYDSDPHPTCKCVRCVRGRRWLKNQGKHTAKQRKEVGTDSSDSEVNTAPKSKPQNTGKKGGKKVAVDSEGDGETSESVTRSKEEPEPKKKTGGKKKQKQNKIENAQSVDKKRNKKANADTEESATEGTSAKMKKGKKNGNEGHEAESSTKVKQRDGQKKGDYPEAFPGPHPRRPHYIEPVRAEVVQTERVLETPQDPPPNAYYDAEHNIIRVYHGPVWGGNPNQSLYPRRDSSMRPLPIGMPHPMQNPYYHGFNNPPPQQQPGLENFPVTQGMPMNAWTSMCPPLGFPPGQLGPGMFDREPATNGGAFHQMSGANGRKAPSTMDKDKAGDNNVVPGSIKVSGLSGHVRKILD